MACAPAERRFECLTETGTIRDHPTMKSCRIALPRAYKIRRNRVIKSIITMKLLEAGTDSLPKDLSWSRMEDVTVNPERANLARVILTVTTKGLTSARICVRRKSLGSVRICFNTSSFYDSNIGVSNDCKKVTINIGVPIFLRDTFTAGAVYPNPEIVTVDKNSRQLETLEASKYAACKLANTGEALGKYISCGIGAEVAWTVPCGTYATGAAATDAKIWGGKGRSVDWWNDHCLSDKIKDMCGSKPDINKCKKAKVAGKTPNYWCDRKDSMPNKIRSELGVKPTISTIVRLGIDVDMARQKMKIKDRTVTLLPRIAK